MAGKRVRSDNTLAPQIHTWQEADSALKRIGVLQSKIEILERETQDKINILKESLKNKVVAHQERISLHLASLETFSGVNRKDFGKKRSRKLNFGTLGWRKSSVLSTKKTTLGLIKKIFGKAAGKNYIHTKETPNKEALAKLTDGQLATLGARREEKDVFFAEPDLNRAADYESKK